ncbi:hypothetical protein VTJ83DRAFT_1151 [Remersonia thermophila]|uniref:Uncharacterized protein n=1 Tax=Remersonia thermophila TaxID=72144 RepID=A0ABR4DNA8_9PEZI
MESTRHNIQDESEVEKEARPPPQAQEKKDEGSLVTNKRARHLDLSQTAGIKASHRVADRALRPRQWSPRRPGRCLDSVTQPKATQRFRHGPDRPASMSQLSITTRHFGKVTMGFLEHGTVRRYHEVHGHDWLPVNERLSWKRSRLRDSGKEP